MNWSPNTSHHIRLARAQMLQKTRAFFLQQSVLEVETPALSLAANTDPFIESFNCSSSTNRYLHTSPEYPMKRLLASGSGDIYQICKVWREGEIGNNHNPEFTLLEWYRLGFDYHQLMQEVAELLQSLIPQIEKNTEKYSYEQLFLEKFSLNPHLIKRERLINCVNKNISGLETNNLDQQALLDALLTHCIEPEFDDNCLTFIYDYPANQSALASLKSTGDYWVAERFEVYLGKSELGNGYQEETDLERNKTILNTENQKRESLKLDRMPEDNNFLQACQAGIPKCAGVAIGLDRVLMGMTGEKSIQKVINFPWDKA